MKKKQSQVPRQKQPECSLSSVLRKEMPELSQELLPASLLSQYSHQLSPLRREGCLSPAQAAAAGLYSTCLRHGLKQRDSPLPVQGSVLQAGAWPRALLLWPEAGAAAGGQASGRAGLAGGDTGKRWDEKEL